MKHMHVPCILPLIKLKIVARLPYHRVEPSYTKRVSDIRYRIHIYMVVFLPSVKSKLST